MTSIYNGGAYDFRDFDDEDDEDVSDDEVFVSDAKRSGASGAGCADDDSGVNKPLMAPRRRKVKTSKLHTEVRRGGACAPIFYALTAVGSLIGVICLVVFLINTFAAQVNAPPAAAESARPGGLDGAASGVELRVGCSNFRVSDVWTQTLPKLTTETAVRLVDVDADGVLDVILGFGTGADGYDVPEVVCDVYFGGQKPCFGGVLALDGRSGREQWRHYAPHEIFALNCNEDLDGDGVADCVAGGRAGVLRTVSGRTGSLLWDFGPQEAKNDIMNVYTPQFVPDQDGDGVVDLVVVHGGDPLADPSSAFRLSGRLLLLSGQSGRVLQWVAVPDDRESYYSPQILQPPDGSPLVMFGTGGETHTGSLWVVPLSDLVKGDAGRASALYHDTAKGIMVPPVVIDINGDGVDDVVAAMFNSTVVAFDGLRLGRQLWNVTFPSSETYSTPAAGYFNDDDVPDFMVKFQRGPGFPVYYYAETQVLDGRDGTPLLDVPVRDTIGTQASPLTIGVEGHGNDLFIYWTANCLGHEGETQQFDFLKETNVHEQSRADLCQLRFGGRSELVTRLHVIGRHVKAPGFVLYSSDARKSLEYSNYTSTMSLGQKFLRMHPEVQQRGPKHRGPGGTSGGKVLGPPPPEYEEVIPYAENHDVRKHGNGGHSIFASQKWPNQGPYYDDYETVPDVDAGRHWPVNDNSGSDIWDDPDSNDYPGGGLIGMQQERQFGARHQPGHHQHHRQRPQHPDTSWGRKYNYRQRLRKRSKRSKDRSQRRASRHVGPHDMDGIQRIISTGTLAPVLPDASPDASNHSIDIVFATYWFFPSKTQAILPEDRDCIQRRMGQEEERFKPDSQFYGMDHDAYEDAVTKECIRRSSQGRKQASNRTYQSQSDYDPFAIHMGQMTVYRLRLHCTCHNDIRVKMAGRSCARVLPFERQPWAAYMGTRANSHYGPPR